MTVYFIQAENGLIKIGRTDELHLKHRICAIRSSSPLPLIVLGIIPDAFSDKSFHRKFSHLRHHGEWFLPGNELLSYIKDKTIAVESESPKQALKLKVRGAVAERKMELFKELFPELTYEWVKTVEEEAGAQATKETI